MIFFYNKNRVNKEKNILIDKIQNEEVVIIKNKK